MLVTTHAHTHAQNMCANWRERKWRRFRKRAIERKPMMLEAWMPKKVEMGNRYRIFQVGEEQKEAEEIRAIKAEEDSGTVSVTVDTGAAKSV